MSKGRSTKESIKKQRRVNRQPKSPSNEFASTGPSLNTESFESQVTTLKGVDAVQRQVMIAQIGRVHGNQHVQRLLATLDTPHIQRALTAQDYDALVEKIHGAMEGLGTDEEAIFVALQKLNKNAAAIRDLKTAYKKKYGSDLVTELQSEMSDSELSFALELLGKSSARKEEKVAAGPPATDAEYEKAAAKLYNAMEGVGTDEEAIYAALIPFNRDSTKLKKLIETYKDKHKGGLTGKGLEADLKDEMSSDELAYALYLLKAPPPAVPGSSVTIVDPGTEEHKAKVPGGEVSVHTGVKYDKGSGAVTSGGYSVGYKGGLSADTGILQFLWSEIVATQPDGKEKYVAETGLATTQAATMDLTTDPSKPAYKVDSATATSPFYESGGINIRTAASTTIVDRPAEFASIMLRQFDAGATKVVERDHFEVFLIQDYNAIYHLTVVVEWVYTSKTTSTRKTSFGSGGKVTKLPAGMRKQLVKEYPDFDYIQ